MLLMKQHVCIIWGPGAKLNVMPSLGENDGHIPWTAANGYGVSLEVWDRGVACSTFNIKETYVDSLSLLMNSVSLKVLDEAGFSNVNEWL